MRTDQAVTIRREDYAPAPFEVPATELVIELDPTVTRITATLQLERRHPGPLVLDGVELALESIEIDGTPLAPERYRRDDATLVIDDLPDRCRLRTVVTIDPAGNTALEGLYRSSGTFCTQCEAEGFRKIAYAIDRPDVLSVYDVTLIAAPELATTLLCNGNLVAERTLPDGRREVRWHDPHPKPSYLFATVAGHLEEIVDRYVTASGREVRLSIHVEAHNADRCDFAMASLKHAMAWDEAVYGLEYDLDRYMIVAVDDFNMGAMENKGLNVFNSKFVLADSDTATDNDFLWIEAVIAHEYFHNWTGNRITCRDWFQLSLKEGLTVFRDQCFTADRHSATVKRIADVRRLRASQFPEDAGPLAHPIRPDAYVEINNFYTATVYEKGAEVVRMLHTLLGDATFMRGFALYVERHDGTAATCEDFVRAMETASGRDFTQFRLWYSLAGTPVVNVEERWQADIGRLTLTLRQRCPDTPGQRDKPPMQLPIAFGLIGPDGRDLPVVAGDDTGPGADASDTEAVTRLFELREREQRLVFRDLAARPTVSWLRGFSAPVRLEVARDADTLGFLAAHDNDGVGRWEAFQQLVHRAIAARLDPASGTDADELEATLTVAVARTLERADEDPALAAETLQLPGIEVLGEERESIDPAALDAARQALAGRLAEAQREALLALVAPGRSDEPTVFGGIASGRRALRGAALALLCTLDEAVWVDVADTLYREARTMTDRVAALGALCQAGDAARTAGLDDFHARHAGNALVIDKWFALQAMSRRADTLDTVRALAAHADFDSGNPNRVRALLASFAAGNPLRFHDPSGGGHRFLSDHVIALDARNPQLAARLVAPLGRWRRYVPTLGASMRAELERIRDGGARSPDVLELVTRSLGEPAGDDAGAGAM